MEKLFVFYQPNNKDKKNEYGDCTIRALSKALNLTWLQTFDLVLPFMRERQCLTSGMPQTLYKEMIENIGFKYHGISNAKGTSRPTVCSFASEHPKGTFVLKVSHHHVTVVNGKYYDTWDSGRKCVYGYYQRLW